MPREFTEDIHFNAEIYGLCIRSPAARGRLLGFDVPQMASSYFFASAENIPGRNELDDYPAPILASGNLCYTGQPAALLFGPDPARLRAYAAGIKVLYDEEEGGFGFGSPLPPHAERNLKLGQPAAAGAKAPFRIITGTYRTGVQDPLNGEPCGAAAAWKGEREQREAASAGKLHVYAPSQWPFHVRASVAGMLKLDKNAVLVESMPTGFHLDGRIWYPSLLACFAALGSYLSRKPVIILLPAEEDFRFSPKRFASHITIESAVDESGNLLRNDIEALADLGAHGVFTDELLDRAALGSFGAYVSRGSTLKAKAVRSNIPPQGPFAGFGMAQGFFAAERQASRIADELGRNPADWRKEQVFAKNSPLAIGAVIKESVPAAELIDTAAAISDYNRKWYSYEMLRRARRGQGPVPADSAEFDEPLRGIGITLAYQGSGFLYHGRNSGAYAVEVTLEKDGGLEIRTSMTSFGEGTRRLWQHLAADILTIEPEKVQLIAFDTTKSPDSGPSSLSRNTLVLSRLVENCCTVIRRQRFRDPLPITVRKSVKPSRAAAWDPAGDMKFDQNAFARLGWGAAVVEVEVDLHEYRPLLRGIWLAVDGGRIISETEARHELRLQTLAALGWASTEFLEYRNGVISRQDFSAYGIPDIREEPPISIDFLWSDTAEPKGIGELPGNTVPAAYVQAVSQAMDYPFEKIPLGPRDILEARRDR